MTTYTDTELAKILRTCTTDRRPTAGPQVRLFIDCTAATEAEAIQPFYEARGDRILVPQLDR